MSFELTVETARRVAEERCDAWNRKDLDAVMAPYAENVAFSSPTVVKRRGIADGWLHGSTRLRENFAIGRAAEGLRFDLVDVVIGVTSMCVIYRRETGQLVNDTVELDEQGKAIRVVACYGAKP
ncbi:MAG TPA: nuclear transport factor 2 family protein [Roseiarcus sp.]